MGFFCKDCQSIFIGSVTVVISKQHLEFGAQFVNSCLEKSITLCETIVTMAYIYFNGAGSKTTELGAQFINGY